MTDSDFGFPTYLSIDDFFFPPSLFFFKNIYTYIYKDSYRFYIIKNCVAALNLFIFGADNAIESKNSEPRAMRF